MTHMEQYEDDEATRARVLSNSQVLAFIAGYWGRRPWLFAATVAFTLAAVGCELVLPAAAKGITDGVVKGARQAGEAWRAWRLFVFAFLGAGVLRNISVRAWMPLAVGTMREMTNEGFARVQSFSAEWHGNTFAGATVRRLSRAMWGYDTAADCVVIFILPAALVLVGLSIQMILRWPLVGAFSLGMVALYITSTVALNAFVVRRYNMRSVAMDSRIGGALADAITSNPTVKGFGAEPREEARIGAVTADWGRATMTAWMRYTDVWLFHNLLLALLQAGLTGLLIIRWTHGQASAGDLAFVITSFLVMSGYLRNMGDDIRMLQRGLADVEDVARYATMAPQVADTPGAPDFHPLEGQIAFEHVTFSYNPGRAPIYDDFSLAIAPGERLALVGPTGSGKSTFVKLIQRLYDLQGGRILIDGVDIAGVAQASLRRGIAVVPQDPALFHRTIADNIAYARPGATAEEIALAARRARAHDFIAALPKGYDTVLGEGGGSVSQGQKQLLAFARAVLADPRVLILDEATSSLDVETELQVQAATEELMAGRTTIVIAHRLSTVRRADRILVFEEGRVIEEGRHGDLIALGGAYARLHAVTQGA